jgi:hypothetical protein
VLGVSTYGFVPGSGASTPHHKNLRKAGSRRTNRLAV